ncbi:MAG: hypothetical protein COW29_06240 [Rhodobacterales bacterium CG15_BIG_FIL_POST_REV_8_21_14_020_59_13]|nr:MAG: hypothetical protein COW29_06240 [Rhodobacterales bacterium CG15_BIG_FIL_POST_REV_8_21_14_020_59_13]
MTRFLSELRRRNVFRVAAAYLVAGWIVMQVVATIGAAAGLPDWADSLALILLIAGFPVVLFIAWAFELTPEGLKQTEAVDAPTGFKPLGPGDYVLIAAVLVVLGVGGAQLVRAPDGDESHGIADGAGAAPVPDSADIADSSIAVLPFADLSPAGDQQYFSDGIAEEILNVLVRIDGLDVASRTSAFQYRGEDYLIPEIAEALGVRHILEGSVRRDGETVRITAQLIDARGDRHLWSETYDRPLTTGAIFAVQDEIATAIVEALRVFFDETAPEPVIAVEAVTDDVDAYTLYLEARAHFQARDNLDDADALLERALAIDPEFSQAWEMRAALPSLMEEYFFADISRDEVDHLTRLYAARALAINPDSALAVATLAKIRMNASAQMTQFDDWSEILAQYERARNIDPLNASVLLWQGIAQAYVGDIAGSLHSFEQCVMLEPAYRPCRENHYNMLIAAGQDDAALRAIEDALAAGTFSPDVISLGLLARAHRRAEFMIVASTPQRFLGWDGVGDLYEAFQDLGGDHTALARRLRDFIDRNPDRPIETTRDVLYVFDPGSEPLFSVQVFDPSLTRYRQSEHYANFVRNTGILDYWRARGFPPQCRPVGADDFACD